MINEKIVNVCEQDLKEIIARDKIRSMVVHNKNMEIVINIDDFKGRVATNMVNTIKVGTKKEIDTYIKENKLKVIIWPELKQKNMAVENF